jgi:phasin family protein
MLKKNPPRKRPPRQIANTIKEQTMANPMFDFNAAMENTRKALAPATRLAELALQGYERVARQQYAFAGELLELGLKQARIATEVKDTQEMATRQVELTTEWVEKATQRSQEMIKLMSEQQSELTRWYDETSTELSSQARKAA